MYTYTDNKYLYRGYLPILNKIYVHIYTTAMRLIIQIRANMIINLLFYCDNFLTFFIYNLTFFIKSHNTRVFG